MSILSRTGTLPLERAGILPSPGPRRPCHGFTGGSDPDGAGSDGSGREVEGALEDAEPQRCLQGSALGPGAERRKLAMLSCRVISLLAQLSFAHPVLYVGSSAPGLCDRVSCAPLLSESEPLEFEAGAYASSCAGIRV